MLVETIIARKHFITHMTSKSCSIMNSFVNHKLASGREHFLTNITLCSVAPIAGLGCTLPQMSGGDLVAAEQFATARAGKLLPRLDAGVGSLVEPQSVRPAQTCKRCLTMLGIEEEYNIQRRCLLNFKLLLYPLWKCYLCLHS